MTAWAAPCATGSTLPSAVSGCAPRRDVPTAATPPSARLSAAISTGLIIFGPQNGTKCFHTGGIFAALSESTAEVAAEAMDAARATGTMISYDLNYRESLWKSIGGKQKAQEVNRELVRKVDLLLGNEEDFSAMLGVHVKGVSGGFRRAAHCRIRGDAARGCGGVSKPEAGGQHTAHRAHGHAQRMGRHRALPGPDCACDRNARWRSSIAWAAATALPPA